MTSNIPDELREHAWDECPHCHGTGIETVERTQQGFELNLCNGNARLLLALLRLDDECLYGSASLPDVRRAIMFAKNTDRSGFTRDATVGRAVARQCDDGTAFIAPNVFVGGFSADDLEDRLARLEEVVDNAQAFGASEITWG